jgi:predicted branched-subunit amino acid permease
MAHSNTKTTFLRGARDGAPFVLVVLPFSLLFGVVASEAGLNFAQVMGMSVLVIAGAAQFTALQLMSEEAPTLIILATSLAVNLRMAMYSAALTPYLREAGIGVKSLIAYFLVDQSYLLSHMKYETEPEMSLPARLAYFFGVVSPVAPSWYLGTWLGAVMGAAIPPAFALDFAVPITFVAMVAPMLKSPAHVAAAITSVITALALSPLPYGTGLLVAGVAAMLVGAQVELFRERRAS